MNGLLARIDAAFTDVGKPAHFTDHRHCCECKEHDDTLLARTRESIRREDLGHMGWDPLTFSSEEGIGYLFPALARLALGPDSDPQRDWYGVQLVWHLTYGGAENRFLRWCSRERRRAVHALLERIYLDRAGEVANYALEEDIETALELWKTSPTAPRR